jgi:hypothetical protein
LPEDTRLIIFAPRMSAERREDLLKNIRGSAATAGLPILELSTVLDEARAEQDGVELVAWPCTAEELVRRIEATLLKTDPTPESGLEVGA